MMYSINDIPIGLSFDRYGEWAQVEISFIEPFIAQDDCVLDIGAHVGSHTLPFAMKVGPSGRVYAFEPQRLLFQMLCGNIALNALLNVIPFHAAVGETSGQVHVPFIDPHVVTNFGCLEVLSCLYGEVVPLLTIDQLSLPRCNFMKIDVEGAENIVLKGAMNTIQCFRPTIYTENNRLESSAETIDILHSCGYRCWWHLYHRFNPNNFFGNSDNFFVPLSIEANLLCLHESVDASRYDLQALQPVLDREDTWEKAWERMQSH